MIELNSERGSVQGGSQSSRNQNFSSSLLNVQSFDTLGKKRQFSANQKHKHNFKFKQNNVVCKLMSNDSEVNQLIKLAEDEGIHIN